MSYPFGRFRKTPEQNCSCFLGAANAYIDRAKGESYKEKHVKKFDKYLKRMVSVLNGQYKKCKNTRVCLLLHLTLLGKPVGNRRPVRSQNQYRLQIISGARLLLF
jgi:hypothetical protein